MGSPLVVLARAPASVEEVVRQAVAECWHRPVAELQVERSATGKPYVIGGPAFNVSHSGGWVAVAAAGTGDVGVDIEQIRAVKPRVAQRVFGTADLTPDEFTRRWTIAEACVKADGRGIGLLLDEGGFGSLGDAATGTWRDFRWWSGRVEGAYWAVALSEKTAAEPVVRVR